MKRRVRLIILAVIVLAILALASCNQETKSKSERISEFFSDLNANDWTSLYTHIHPDNGARNSAKASSFWIPDPFDNGFSFSRSNYNESGSTVTVTVNVTGDDNLDGSWSFSMKEDTKDLWYINGLTIPDAGSLF